MCRLGPTFLLHLLLLWLEVSEEKEVSFQNNSHRLQAKLLNIFTQYGRVLAAQTVFERMPAMVAHVAHPDCF